MAPAMMDLSSASAPMVAVWTEDWISTRSTGSAPPRMSAASVEASSRLNSPSMTQLPPEMTPSRTTGLLMISLSSTMPIMLDCMPSIATSGSLLYALRVASSKSAAPSLLKLSVTS